MISHKWYEMIPRKNLFTSHKFVKSGEILQGIRPRETTFEFENLRKFES